MDTHRHHKDVIIISNFTSRHKHRHIPDINSMNDSYWSIYQQYEAGCQGNRGDKASCF